MLILKCKMCGGTIEFNPRDTVCTCEYCNTKQTLPRLDDDRRVSLYDRASHFRRNNEFDKAMAIYEQIIIEDNTDAEAYWSLVLCKYGIEYVEDPDTHKRVPTVNRTQYTSVLVDEDYKKAVQYASVEQRILYEDEAKTIDEILRGILEISSKEDPFDIFICYKETDNDGRRTRDSVMATDIYNQLTQEGYKVFFSRITLEDKFGTAYEPYIFAALNSAKVMVVVGTKLEYFNATWVKNEWSRYLGLIKKGEKKVLIPVYKDIDPYDLPEEFAYLQAQDMSRLGFLQDLIRGIKKIIGVNEPSNTQPAPTVVQTYSSNITALLDRGNMAIEDGEWDKADGFFEEVLNQDAKCAEAYLGKFLVANQAKSLSDYKDKIVQATEYAEPQKVQGTLDQDHIDSIVQAYVIPNYLSKDKLRGLYNYDLSFDSDLDIRESQKEEVLSGLKSDGLFNRIKQYSTGTLAEDVGSFEASLEAILDDRIADSIEIYNINAESINTDCAEFIVKADEKAESMYKDAMARKETDYNKAIRQAKNASTSEMCNHAIDSLAIFNGYQDADAILSETINKRDEYLREEEKSKGRKARKRKRIVTVAICAIVAVIVAVAYYQKVVVPQDNYNHAIKLMEAGDYSAAIEEFEELDGYKDSEEKIVECNNLILDEQYTRAVSLMDDGRFEEAISEFESLDGYRDSEAQIKNCNNGIQYNKALSFMESGRYQLAINSFTEIDGYNDSDNLIIECKYQLAIHDMNVGHYEKAISEFMELGDYGDCREQIINCNNLIWNDTVEKLRATELGSHVIFGDYNGHNQWTLIAQSDNKVLLLCDESVGLMAFDENGSNEWETCTLNSWLNGEYYSQAFSEREQELMIDEGYGLVFLLSSAQAHQYFHFDSERAINHQWWLRSPGRNSSTYAALVGLDGYVIDQGDYVGSERCVRPAVWIDLSRIEQS